MIDGKSIWSWNVPAISMGTTSKFVQGLLDNGFTGVALKAANGNWVQWANSSAFPGWGTNIKPDLVDALKEAGIKIYFWHFLYGNDPTGEARVAIDQTYKFGGEGVIDGYLWDVEGAFDSKPNAETNARIITQTYKKALPNIPQALCWWALPKSPSTGAEYHPIKVAKAFLEVCQVAMPMMYWQGGTPSLAAYYFNTSIKLWREFTNKPIIPIGRAYDGDGGYANAPAIEAFANEVDKNKTALNLSGISWWSYDVAYKNPDWLDAIHKSPPFDTSPPTVPPPTTNPPLTIEDKVDRLVKAHPELFPEL